MTVLQHLHSRYLDTDIHRVWVSEQKRCAEFPLWTLSGQLVGYQRYRPSGTKEKDNDPREGRYFTRLNRDYVCVWGLESWNFSNTLYITEGIFDACRITYFGFSAIALLSFSASTNTKSWLANVRTYRPTVAICDADSSGVRLARHARVARYLEQGDLGAASQKFVSTLLKNTEQSLNENNHVF